jgi:sulfatase modifying factor 1
MYTRRNRRTAFSGILAADTFHGSQNSNLAQVSEGSRSAHVQRLKLESSQLEDRVMPAINMIMLPIGNVRNAADPATGYGRVNESYQISKYEVTIGDYAAFLNSVAKSDPHFLYNTNMANNAMVAGIGRTGTDGSYVYEPIKPAGVTPSGANDPANRPVTFVNWYDAARFANWMANGQPVGSQSASTTENGSYNMTNPSDPLADPDQPPVRNATNPNTNAPPSFYLPTEDQWYKAAFYSPAINHNAGGYYRFATQSNTNPGNAIGAGPNRVNYILPNGQMTVTQEPLIDPKQNYLTNVGAMSGSGSYYGTFDQNGNVWEILDTNGTEGKSGILRGGAYTSFTSYLGTYRLVVDPNSSAPNGGFRLAGPIASPKAVKIDTVKIGDAGNPNDTVTGKGAVAYDYTIGRTNVTVAQYTSFLNAVAKSDPHGLYNTLMSTDLNVAGINRVGRPGSYSYSVMNNFGNAGNRPIAYVSWFDSARFSNWVANGQPTGGQNVRTTENGAYNLTRASKGLTVPRNLINPNTRSTPTFFIPTEAEWYKAAYYSTSAQNYSTYSMGTGETAPTNNAALASSTQPWANYLQGVIYSTTQSNVYYVTQNYLSDADAFPDSASSYGTLNQTGTLYQWNDLNGRPGRYRGVSGGFWAGGSITLQRTCAGQYTANYEGNDVSFRLVGPPQVVTTTKSASPGTPPKPAG